MVLICREIYVAWGRLHGSKLYTDADAVVSLLYDLRVAKKANIVISGILPPAPPVTDSAIVINSCKSGWASMPLSSAALVWVNYLLTSIALSPAGHTVV